MPLGSFAIKLCHVSGMYAVTPTYTSSRAYGIPLDWTPPRIDTPPIPRVDNSNAQQSFSNNLSREVDVIVCTIFIKYCEKSVCAVLAALEEGPKLFRMFADTAATIASAAIVVGFVKYCSA